MLATRDQENLAHDHQTTAASKPFNQSTRQLAPKTPGNKVPKTPFKLPLNDENGATGFGGGKTGLRLKDMGNDGLMTGGKKGTLLDRNAFITPMGPRDRAPLGLKTTNARAKAFQTPAGPGTDNPLDKTSQKSGTARKPKPRTNHAEMSKVEVVGETDEAEEREIEYMPPRPEPLPDYPEDWPHDVDYSRFKGSGLTRGWYQHYCNPIGEDGLTLQSRRWKEQGERIDKYYDELIQREVDNMQLVGINVSEFPGEDTVEDTIRKEMMEHEHKQKAGQLPSKPSNGSRKPLSTKGPATITSRKAAGALSQPKQASTTAKQQGAATTVKAKMPSSTVTAKKTPQPTNPSTMRHTAAVAASRTTMGYSKGRATSSTIKQSILSKKSTTSNTPAEVPDKTLAPAAYIQRYGVPPVGSEMWIRCFNYGCFEKDEDCLEDALTGVAPTDPFEEDEAEADFQLVC